MALIAVTADKGAPGVTTTALALAAVWPRPVLLAECDPAGGDLVYRLPAADGGRLDPRRGLLSLAVAARRGLQPHQVWEHTQKLSGGLDILTGVTNAEQGAGLSLLWGPVGRALAASSQADVIADCGRLGVDGPLYDLLAEAALVVLVTRASLGEVVRLRDRVAAVATAVRKRGRAGAGAGAGTEVVVIAGHKHLRTAIAEIGQVLEPMSAPVRVAGGLADDPKGAELLRGEWSGKLDKSLLIRTARDIAGNLVARLPALVAAGPDRDPAATADGEPLVSAATWAAAPGAGYAAVRGHPPLAAPPSNHQPPPDESHAAGLPGVTGAGLPGVPGAGPPGACAAHTTPSAGPGTCAAAPTAPPAEPGTYAAVPLTPPAPPAPPAAEPPHGRDQQQAGESEPGQPGR